MKWHSFMLILFSCSISISPFMLKISNRLIDTIYAIGKSYRKGGRIFNVVEVSEILSMSVDRIDDSLRSLVAKGLLSFEKKPDSTGFHLSILKRPIGKEFDDVCFSVYNKLKELEELQ